jgi:hypothetical protein
VTGVILAEFSGGMTMDGGDSMGVQEHYVSSARTAAVAAWTLTGVLMTAGWVVALAYPEAARPAAAMLGFTAMVTAVIATTMQVRIYVVRVCSLIRRSGLTSVETGDNVRAFQN